MNSLAGHGLGSACRNTGDVLDYVSHPRWSIPGRMHLPCTASAFGRNRVRRDKLGRCRSRVVGVSWTWSVLPPSPGGLAKPRHSRTGCRLEPTPPRRYPLPASRGPRAAATRRRRRSRLPVEQLRMHARPPRPPALGTSVPANALRPSVAAGSVASSRSLGSAAGARGQDQGYARPRERPLHRGPQPLL